MVITEMDIKKSIKKLGKVELLLALEKRALSDLYDFIKKR